MTSSSIWMATLLGGLALAFFAVNMALTAGNADRERDVEARQTAINRGAAIEQITMKIAQDLNEIGNRYDDRPLCTMLRAEGMAVKGKCGMLDGTVSDEPPGHAPHR